MHMGILACSAIGYTRGGRSHIFRQTPILFQNFWIRIRVRAQKFFKFENPTPVQTPATIDATEIQQCFSLRNDIYKDHAWLLLLSKMSSSSWSVSGFSQIFDSGSGSERKTQNPAGVGSGNPDPWPALLHTSIAANLMQCYISCSWSLFKSDWMFKCLSRGSFPNFLELRNI